MTKHDWFWVAVKVSGLIALLYAVVALVTLFTVFSDMPFGSILWRLVLNVGVVAGLGIWLLVDGNLLIKMARSSDRSTGGS